MDAAVDAMTKTYGFSEEIVKRVAKELLKVRRKVLSLSPPSLSVFRLVCPPAKPCKVSGKM